MLGWSGALQPPARREGAKPRRGSGWNKREVWVKQEGRKRVGWEQKGVWSGPEGFWQEKKMGFWKGTNGGFGRTERWVWVGAK
jgi:hypothetical protein